MVCLRRESLMRSSKARLTVLGRLPLSGRLLLLPLAVLLGGLLGLGAGFFSRISCSTSSRMMRPPDPETSAGSTSYSCASFLTDGEAWYPPSSRWSFVSSSADSACGCSPPSLAGAGSSASSFSSGSGCGAVAYRAYDLSDVDGLALALGDGFEDAVLFGLDLEVDLIGLELDEGLARLDLIPSLFSHLPTVASVTDSPSSGTCISGTFYLFSLTARTFSILSRPPWGPCPECPRARSPCLCPRRLP